MTRSDTAKLWAERLQRFHQAEMTVAQFCSAEGVSAPSFYNWRRKLRSALASEAPTATFMPVSLQRKPERTEDDQTRASATIELPGGIRVRIEVPIDRQQFPQGASRP